MKANESYFHVLSVITKQQENKLFKIIKKTIHQGVSIPRKLEVSNIRYQCPKCELSLKSQRILKRHIKYVHEADRVVRFPCSFCDFKGKVKATLQLHIQSIHLGEKFSCPQCEYKSTQKSSLRTHIKSIHEGQKIPCPYCEYKGTAS